MVNVLSKRGHRYIWRCVTWLTKPNHGFSASHDHLYKTPWLQLIWFSPLHCYAILRQWLTHLPLAKMAAILADDIFKCIFLNENDKILFQISALVQVMAWRRAVDRPLPEPKINQFTDEYMRHKTYEHILQSIHAECGRLWPQTSISIDEWISKIIYKWPMKRGVSFTTPTFFIAWARVPDGKTINITYL